MTDNSSTNTEKDSAIMVAVLIGIATIYPLGMVIFVPSMPSMVGYFGSTSAEVQLILTLYLISSVVSMLIAGPASDRLGRRRVLLAGLALHVIGSVLCSFAGTLNHLLIGRIIQAMGGAVGATLCRSIIRDVYSREKAASMLGYVTMGMSVAPMLGPLIGGILHELFGWRWVFHFLSLAGLLVFVATWMHLPETLRFENRNGKGVGLLSSLGALSKRFEFLYYSGTNLFCPGVFFTFLGGGPFIAEELLKMTPGEYGTYSVLVAGGYMLGNYLTARFTVRYGIDVMIITGNWVTVAGVASIALLFFLEFFHPVSLFVPMFFVGVANGLTLTNAMAGAVSVRPDLAGAAAGLGSSMQVTSGALASILIGWLLSGILWPGTIWPLVICMAAYGLITLAVGYLRFAFVR